MAPRAGRFRCRKCKAESRQWLSVCPVCKAWECIERLPDLPRGVPIGQVAADPATQMERYPTGLASVDGVLGGGLVAGSVLLLGGEPGQGKSTLLLWVGELLARSGKRVLYVAGEETPEQVAERGKRIGATHANLMLLKEEDTAKIAQEIAVYKPHLVLIDSLQTMLHPEWSGYPPGSPTQLKATAGHLCAVAKKYKATLWFVGHVDKQGNLAGPNTVMHMVDVVLYLEGNPNEKERLLAGVKNRFGACEPVALLEMRADGLKEPEPEEKPIKSIKREKKK